MHNCLPPVVVMHEREISIDPVDKKAPASLFPYATNPIEIWDLSFDDATKMSEPLLYYEGSEIAQSRFRREDARQAAVHRATRMR